MKIPKQFGLSSDAIKKLLALCKNENRSQSNMIETLINDRYEELSNDKEQCISSKINY